MSRRPVPLQLVSSFNTLASIRDQIQPDPFCEGIPPAEKEYLRRKAASISREVSNEADQFLLSHGFAPGGHMIPKKRR